MIAAMKFLHVSALTVWCAGLIALPILLHFYGRGDTRHTQLGFERLRHLTHYSYTGILGPSAVIAISAGTALIFLIELVDTWLLIKLIFVAGMALVHAWLGHLTSQLGHSAGKIRIPPPLIALVAVVPMMLAVLFLVLAKPDLAPLLERLPLFLRVPQGRELPESVVPI